MTEWQWKIFMAVVRLVWRSSNHMDISLTPDLRILEEAIERENKK